MSRQLRIDIPVIIHYRELISELVTGVMCELISELSI